MNQLELFPETIVKVQIIIVQMLHSLQLCIAGPGVVIHTGGQSITDILHHSPYWANYIKNIYYQGEEIIDIQLPETVWKYWTTNSIWSNQTFSYKAKV